jgi:septum formation protein
LRIVLASGSSARKAMLKAAGVAFEVTAPDVDEAAVKARGGSAREIATALARLKAFTGFSSLPCMGRAETERSEVRGGEVRSIPGIAEDPLVPTPFAARVGPPHEGEGGWLVIGSDQTLELHGQTLSKAASLSELRSNLIQLRGRTHALHSAVAVAHDGEIVWRHVDTAYLTMRAFSDAFLDDYVARHGEKVRSSLGGYWFEAEGVQLFDKVAGDYFTILGMPLLPLLGYLREAGTLAA